MKIIKTTETYYDFVRTAKTRKESETAKRYNRDSSRTNDYAFSQTKNFDEAFELATNGWDAGLKQLKLDDGLMVGSGMEFTPAVHGAVVNMGAYLTGQPETMYNLTEKREFNLEPLTVYAHLSYAGRVTGTNAMNFTKSMLEHINYYQSKHNLKIVGVFDSKQNGVRWINHVIIKDFDSRFVMNNLAFSFHPSFFRRLWFAKLEGEEFIASGYGSSTSDPARTDYLRSEKNSYGKSLVTPHLQELRGDGSFSRNQMIEL